MSLFNKTFTKKIRGAKLWLLTFSLESNWKGQIVTHP